MLPYFALQAGLAIVATLIVTVIIKNAKNTHFHYKTSTHLRQGFLYAKSVFMIRLFILCLCLSIPLYILFFNVLSAWDVLITLIGFPLFLALFITPELNTAQNAKLVITKPLLSSTVTLHLKAPYQGFDRQTYQELFALVECLPQYDVKTLSLASPMFYNANGQLRSLKLLEKGLNKRGARLSHSPAGTFDCLLGKISMLLSRNKGKNIQKNKVDLLRWHNITIHLLPLKVEIDTTPITSQHLQSNKNSELLRLAELKLERQALNLNQEYITDGHDKTQQERT